MRNSRPLTNCSGVGKTSLVQRYIKGTFTPAKTTSTIGASFLTKRAFDVDSGTTVRLQVWDTAGQERFHSITKLYYRGASAVILVYSIIDETSFVEMGRWLREVKEHLEDDIILHVVGTKTDMVAQDPSSRQVPFERCIAYVAENLHPTLASTPPPSAGSLGGIIRSHSPASALDGTAQTKRSSGFWGNDIGWDICHEISASSGEGIEEVFRVITRKLVEKNTKKAEDAERAANGLMTPSGDGAMGYFDRAATDGTSGTFRLGMGDKRRSWLGFPTPSIGGDEVDVAGTQATGKRKKGGCC